VLCKGGGDAMWSAVRGRGNVHGFFCVNVAVARGLDVEVVGMAGPAGVS
jgi:hypothetical protein